MTIDDHFFEEDTMKSIASVVDNDINLPTSSLIDDYLNQIIEVSRKISRKEIDEIVWVLYNAWRSGRRIYTFGNGGSATTAAHLANDLNKVTIVEGKPRLRAAELTSNIALMTAWSNDNGYEEIFSQQLVNLLEPGDVVIGISTSGNSANILRAFEVGHSQGAVCVGLTGNDGGQLKHLVDYCLFVPDPIIYRQEDMHMIVCHMLAITLRWLISSENG